jgi:CheY-like chemotaxis protein
MLPVPGLELLRRARQIYPGMMTILLSGKSHADDIHAALQARTVDFYLPKPWDSTLLLETICRTPPPARVDAGRMSDQERALCMARLEGLFDSRELNIDAGQAPSGSFAGKIRRAEFWHLKAAEIVEGERFSPAARFYMQHYWEPAFETAFMVWMQNFFAARRDPESGRDILILFLYLNLEHLKQLYILDQPRNWNIAPRGPALQACLSAPENRRLQFAPTFSQWVLEDWLPFQLRYHHHRARVATTASTIQDRPKRPASIQEGIFKVALDCAAAELAIPSVRSR